MAPKWEGARGYRVPKPGYAFAASEFEPIDGSRISSAGHEVRDQQANDPRRSSESDAATFAHDCPPKGHRHRFPFAKESSVMMTSDELHRTDEPPVRTRAAHRESADRG